MACRGREPFWIPAFFCVLIFMLAAAPASAQERVRVTAQDMKQYGRIVLTFPERYDLPPYKLLSDNGVLAVEFEKPVKLELPDISGSLLNYVTVARVDPDHKGFRVGLKGAFRINKIEAGERLFLDILPESWRGILPGLPRDVIAELSARAQDAAVAAERKRKAEIVADEHPKVDLRVGRHATFTRLEFEWDRNVEAKFDFTAPEGKLSFSLPMAIDLYPIKSQMPPELLKIENGVNIDGNTLTLTTAEGVVPRFYEETPRHYVIDIDSANPSSTGDVDIASLLPDKPKEMADATVIAEDSAVSDGTPVPTTEQVSLTPTVKAVGATVRVTFPFENDTAAAVFRRDNVLWMVFDTSARIDPPAKDSGLDAVASGFDVVSAGNTEIVRMTLATERLATLASEGRAWVLSLGDVLLAPSEPMTLERRQDEGGVFTMVANLEKPGKVHQLRDPQVGDVLDVVTAYPPSRQMVRTLDYVDFSALKSVHGLVVRPTHDDVAVTIAKNEATISAPGGLILSAPQQAHAADAHRDARQRAGFIDLNPYVEVDQAALDMRIERGLDTASKAERGQLDPARLNLAKLYLANRLPQEAIGVLTVMQGDLTDKQLEPDVQLAMAAADVSAFRFKDALSLLKTDDMSGRVDALMWRAMAKAESHDFKGAHQDFLAAEPVIGSYPGWVQAKFLLAGSESGLESGDREMASRFLGQVDTALLTKEQLLKYQILTARIDELGGRDDEALDLYGQVIAADNRPTKAEAIYRTIVLLDKMGRLDPLRASETLASEAMVWRGDDLEANMLKLLAELYFRAHDFRSAFDTVHKAALAHPESKAIDTLLAEASQVFSDLYLNGQADGMAPVEALTLYYDYRDFTPAGARGDEMIRNLARRLIKVDLLDQAADLLDYQIQNRLQGAAKAQVAADLAIIQIANRKPQAALKALNDSRVAGLPPAVERQRRILEARALVDAGREDLALDLLSSMDGRDADLLRVDAHWAAKRYDDAAEILERLYSSDQYEGQLSPPARTNIVRAAVGFVLAKDRIGLTRLRSKFGDRMSKTPEWPMFDFVTSAVSADSLQFREVAQQVANVDSLDAFLKSYRDVYEGDGALTPKASSKGG